MTLCSCERMSNGSWACEVADEQGRKRWVTLSETEAHERFGLPMTAARDAIAAVMANEIARGAAPAVATGAVMHRLLDQEADDASLARARAHFDEHANQWVDPSEEK